MERQYQLQTTETRTKDYRWYKIVCLFSYFILFALWSCTSDSKSDNAYLPANSGTQGELLIVAPASFWSSDEANLLRKALLKPYEGLPAEEPFFTSVEVQSESFGSLLKTHRNILEFRIDHTNATQVVKRENIFAKQQTQILVTLNKLGDAETFIETKLNSVLNLFHNAEIDRLASRNRAFGSENLNEKVAELTGVEGILQQDFEIALEKEQFVWLRLDREKPIGGYQHPIKQGIMIYSRPYRDTAQFSDSSLIEWKLSMNKDNIPGPKTSYMGIEDRFVKPIIRSINFRGEAAKEIRGLWRMQGAKGVFMGGPFYALAFYNPQNKRQYMIEGYVYGPQFNKRAFVREIEAIVKSYKPKSE